MKGFCCSCCSHSYLIAEQRARALCLFHTSVQDNFSCETADFSQERWVFMLNWTDGLSNFAFCL